MTAWESFVLSLHNLVRWMSASDIKVLQPDSTNTLVEQVPILIDQPLAERIKRLF